MKNVYWVVLDKYGNAVDETMCKLRKHAISSVTPSGLTKWEWYQERGWRCVKVRIEVLP